ncbi:MAG: N-acetyltransferase family protein [bacterium]
MHQPNHSPCEIRFAKPGDAPLIHTFIRELAEYERLSQAVTSSEKDIHEALFGERPAAECLLAFLQDQPAGFALFFTTFSTFVGRPGLYLEDIYVKPAWRGMGIGKALLSRLAGIAKERRCGRMEWSVLNWNEPAIGFYKKLGARPLDEWTVYRLSGSALDALAAGHGDAGDE